MGFTNKIANYAVALLAWLKLSFEIYSPSFTTPWQTIFVFDTVHDVSKEQHPCFRQLHDQTSKVSGLGDNNAMTDLVTP